MLSIKKNFCLRSRRVRKLDDLSLLKSGAELNLIGRMFERTSMNGSQKCAEWCEMWFICQFATSISPFHTTHGHTLLPLTTSDGYDHKWVKIVRLTAEAIELYTHTTLLSLSISMRSKRIHVF